APSPANTAAKAPASRNPTFGSDQSPPLRHAVTGRVSGSATRTSGSPLMAMSTPDGFVPPRVPDSLGRDQSRTSRSGQGRGLSGRAAVAEHRQRGEPQRQAGADEENDHHVASRRLAVHQPPGGADEDGDRVDIDEGLQP